MLTSITLVYSLILTIQEPALDLRKRNIAARFEPFDGCMVIKEVGTGPMHFFNERDCRRRLPPCSTFKIFNALVALDTGVLDGPDTLLKWAGKPERRKECEKDHTLASAIRDSVVWYFQEVARRIGSERMQRYLNECDYGNRDISADIDTFWLEKSLTISAVEQLRFLEQLYTDKLPFKPEVMKSVRAMIVLKRGLNWTFSGKTGSGSGDTDKGSLGWFVGHLQAGNRQYVFAGHIRGAGAMGSKMRDIVFAILQDLDLMDAEKTRDP